MTWTESERPNGDFVIAFAGIDKDATEAAEMRTFLEQVKQEKGKPRSEHTAAVTATRVALGASVGLVLLGAVAPAHALLGAIGLGGASGATALVRAYRKRREARALAARPYELVLAAESFAFEVRCEGVTSLAVPLGEIDRFVGGRRLSIARMDGTTQRLSACLEAAREHRALADRLTERLHLARAARGGYR